MRPPLGTFRLETCLKILLAPDLIRKHWAMGILTSCPKRTRCLIAAPRTTWTRATHRPSAPRSHYQRPRLNKTSPTPSKSAKARSIQKFGKPARKKPPGRLLERTQTPRAQKWIPNELDGWPRQLMRERITNKTWLPTTSEFQVALPRQKKLQCIMTT